MFLRSCSFLYRVSFSSFRQSSFSCGWQVLLGSTENREFTQRVNKNDSQASARRLHFPQTTGSFRKLPVISQRAWHASPSRKGIKKKISSLPSFSTEINEISKFARGIFNRSSLIFSFSSQIDAIDFINSIIPPSLRIYFLRLLNFLSPPFPN